MADRSHSLRSTYREILLEHLFAGELMRHFWLAGSDRLEVLKPQVDDGGYDLLLDCHGIVRHVQLKATFRGSKVNRFNVHTALATKPSGCVIVMLFDQHNLELGPFRWFGGDPGQPLPNISSYPIAKHTKGNAQGVKLLRPALRVVPLSAFETLKTIPEISVRLFGTPDPQLEWAADS